MLGEEDDKNLELREVDRKFELLKKKWTIAQEKECPCLQFYSDWRAETLSWDGRDNGTLDMATAPNDSGKPVVILFTFNIINKSLGKKTAKTSNI